MSIFPSFRQLVPLDQCSNKFVAFFWQLCTFSSFGVAWIACECLGLYFSAPAKFSRFFFFFFFYYLLSMIDCLLDVHQTTGRICVAGNVSSWEIFKDFEILEKKWKWDNFLLTFFPSLHSQRLREKTNAFIETRTKFMHFVEKLLRIFFFFAFMEIYGFYRSERKKRRKMGSIGSKNRIFRTTGEIEKIKINKQWWKSLDVHEISIEFGETHVVFIMFLWEQPEKQNALRMEFGDSKRFSDWIYLLFGLHKNCSSLRERRIKIVVKIPIVKNPNRTKYLCNVKWWEINVKKKKYTNRVNNERKKIEKKVF